MLHIVFEYRDDMSRGEWRRQECVVSSVAECKRIYGLGIDCEYRILETYDRIHNTELVKTVVAWYRHFLNIFAFNSIIF